MQHLHDPSEIVRIGSAITEVERYKGIAPHPSRLAHFQQSTVQDRYFWSLGRGGTSPVRALTPAVFLDSFADWALQAYTDCKSDLAQAKSNINAHLSAAVAASINDDQNGDLALHFEYSMHRANLELLRAKLQSLPVKKGEICVFDDLDWNDAVVNACAQMFCETLRATTVFAYSDEEIAAVLDALRDVETRQHNALIASARIGCFIDDCGRE